MGSTHHNREDIYARKQRKGNASILPAFPPHSPQRVVLFTFKVCPLPSGNLPTDTQKGVPCHLLGDEADNEADCHRRQYRHMDLGSTLADASGQAEAVEGI